MFLTRAVDTVTKFVPVEVTSDTSVEVSIGLTRLVLTQGNKVEVPFWVARLLEREGKGKRVKYYSPEDMGVILMREKQAANVPASVTELPKDFYRFMNEIPSIMASERDLERALRLRKTLNIMDEIASIRRKKIVSMAALGFKNPEVMNKLTLEERVMFTQIIKALKLVEVSRQ